MPEPKAAVRSRQGITQLSVLGFKSIDQRQSIDIRQLSILAGANSSGKSSMIQPLLLLKQTLEAIYDPGPLLLDGPNVRFTSADQLLSRTTRTGQLQVGIGTAEGGFVEIRFCRRIGKGLEIEEMAYEDPTGRFVLRAAMNSEEIQSLLPRQALQYPPSGVFGDETKRQWNIVRNRSFLEPRVTVYDSKGSAMTFPISAMFGELSRLQSYILDVIHVTGLRGSPERVYPLGAVGRRFPGIFEKYTASVIARWQSQSTTELAALGKDLEHLGLTWKATAHKVSDTQVELRVGRLPRPARGGARDLVNIADTGFGISQTLPVLVALRVARPGQLVYVEQPEIHLHPRAQMAMAEVLVDAAKRGVRVVAETHSAILILGIQTAVAEKRLDPSQVKLHWFRRSPSGSTEVVSSDVDEEGTFGDWPEDFSDVRLRAESRYLDVMESHFPRPESRRAE